MTPPRDPAGRPTDASDAGIAMVLVIIWSTILLTFSLIVAQSITNQIRPSDHSEKSFQALSAAEAGIDDYRARLANNGTYFASPDPSNAALTGWAPIPGGASQATYTYSVDASAAARSGQIRITSTGRSGGVTRTVEATLIKRSAYDYSYLSNYETVAPNYPGAYTGASGDLTAAEAQTLCANRYWWQAGLVTLPSTTGLHRNSRSCKYTPIDSSMRWYGKMHTNDVWYMDPAIPDISPLSEPPAANQVFNGAISTSCPPPTPTTAGCPANHRWIDPSYVGTTGSYLPTEILDNNVKQWNPAYESVLGIPASSPNLKSRAASGGCLYTGPTRIRFFAGGIIEVTSPDTITSNSFCGGTSLKAATHATTPTTAQNHPTLVTTYNAMVAAGFNGVFYVQDLPAALNDPNHWSVTAPSCEYKSPHSGQDNHYPFVIPDPTVTPNDNALFQGSAMNRGFPLEDTNETGPHPDPWSNPVATKCAKGTVYTEGDYTGQLTVMAEGDVALTGDLLDETVPAADRITPTSSTYGTPSATSTNVLGIVPTGFLYVFHPTANTGGGQWDDGHMTNLILNFATVVLNGCFSVQEFDATPNWKDLTFIGSLGQKYRCRISKSQGNAGYSSFTLRYDQRFRLTKPPPFMLELSDEPWRIGSMSESTVRRDAEARTGVAAQTGSQSRGVTVQYNVLSGAPAGSTLNFDRVLDGYGSVSVTNGKVAFTSANTVGTTVIEFVLTKPDGVKVGQTLTVMVT